MTDLQFNNRRFKAYELIEFHYPKSNQSVMCALEAVDFEQGLLRIVPLPDGPDADFHTYEERWVRYEYCTTPKMKKK